MNEASVVNPHNCNCSQTIPLAKKACYEKDLPSFVFIALHGPSSPVVSVPLEFSALQQLCAQVAETAGITVMHLLVTPTFYPGNAPAHTQLSFVQLCRIIITLTYRSVHRLYQFITEASTTGSYKG